MRKYSDAGVATSRIMHVQRLGGCNTDFQMHGVVEDPQQIVAGIAAGNRHVSMRACVVFSPKQRPLRGRDMLLQTMPFKVVC
jgi:hypothetical protein